MKALGVSALSLLFATTGWAGPKEHLLMVQYGVKLEELQSCAASLRVLTERTADQISALHAHFGSKLKFKELVDEGEDGYTWLATAESLGSRVMIVNDTYVGVAIELKAQDGQRGDRSGAMKLARLGGQEPVRIPYDQVRSLKVYQDAGVSTMPPECAEWPLAPFIREPKGDWRTIRTGFTLGHLHYIDHVSGDDPFRSIRDKELAILYFDRQSGIHQSAVGEIQDLVDLAKGHNGRFEIIEIRYREKNSLRRGPFR